MNDPHDKLAPVGRLLDENRGSILKHGGPYIGTVMQTDDQTYMGRLRVWIPEITSTDPQNEHGWLTVNYASPFFGSTSLSDPDAAADVTNTPQSYGMWFVPPDVGVRVLVMFANLDPSSGYWIGCIPGQILNHMVPGIAHRGTTTSAASSFEPITEYNKYKLKEGVTPESTYAKSSVTPPHLIQKLILEMQGLAKDEARGITTSSARRESPSNVYGISTPGAVTKRKNASPSSGADYRIVTGRAGGHTFVMDDGDLDGKNQLIRIRSSTGGTILINDSIGSVYVINQNGTAWVELTATGRIDVYGKNSVNVHSQQDLNFTADNDVNIFASKSFNLVSPAINIEGDVIKMFGKKSHRTRTPDYLISADSYGLTVAPGLGGGQSSPSKGIRISSDKDVDLISKNEMFIKSKGIEIVGDTKAIVSSKALLTLSAGGILQLAAGGGVVEGGPPAGTISKFAEKVDQDFQKGDNKGNVHPPTGWAAAKNWKVGPPTPPSHKPSAARDCGVEEIPKGFSTGKEMSHVPITPQHEPWPGHEVILKGQAGGGDGARAPPAGAAGPAGAAASAAGSSASATAGAASGAAGAASNAAAGAASAAAGAASAAAGAAGTAAGAAANAAAEAANAAAEKAAAAANAATEAANAAAMAATDAANAAAAAAKAAGG